jgi:hypothetical protein
MDDKEVPLQARIKASHLRDLWLVYRRRTRSLERARVQLDEELERVLTEGYVTQADIARLLGTTRQDVQESRRRQQRRRERGEIP